MKGDRGGGGDEGKTKEIVERTLRQAHTKQETAGSHQIYSDR